ncbi:MAG: response regulator [Desulfobacterales bacterium]|nr:response regulator [Desulfobacterales bacterium]
MEEKPINLLIVDDEEQFLESISKRLSVRGFNVIAVDRGEKAIEAAKEKPIDIALVDLKMPGINGEETLKSLKQEYRWMEIVILTGHGSVESAVECTQGGAYSYLQKPCELDKLLDVLVSAYKKKVMNRKNIDKQKMDSLMKMAIGKSPMDILQNLKKLERG